MNTNTQNEKQLYFVNRLDGSLMNETPVTKEHFTSREGFRVIGDALLYFGLHLANFVAVTE